jgi:ribonuclease Z
MALSVLILGSAAAAPTLARNQTSQLVTTERSIFLVDCGEATQLQLRRYKVRFQQIDHIFISHLHGDHFFGLVGLLSTMHMLGRKSPVQIYGPKELEEVIQTQFKYAGGSLSFQQIYHHVEDRNTPIYEDNEVEISAFEVNHRIKCFGYLFKEKPKPRKINGKRVAFYDVPNYYRSKLKDGADFTTEEGELIPNSALTFDPPLPQSYAYCADSAPHDKYLPFIKGVDLLYHEATFMHTEKNRAKKTYHSTAQQTGAFAAKARVKKLLIGHFSNRYNDLKPLLAEAKLQFKSTALAVEGKVFSTAPSTNTSKK